MGPNRDRSGGSCDTHTGALRRVLYLWLATWLWRLGLRLLVRATAERSCLGTPPAPACNCGLGAAPKTEPPPAPPRPDPQRLAPFEAIQPRLTEAQVGELFRDTLRSYLLQQLGPRREAPRA